MTQQSLARHDPATTVADAPSVGRHGVRRFLLHLAAMVALMYAGMLALDPLYAWLAHRLGSSSPSSDWPMISAVVMTAEMTLPMIPFMRRHGHSRRHVAEMAGAMAAPSLGAAVLYLTGAVQVQAVAGIGHASMLPAMLAAMLYRRRDYSSSAAPHASSGGRTGGVDLSGLARRGSERNAGAVGRAAASAGHRPRGPRPAALDVRHLRESDPTPPSLPGERPAARTRPLRTSTARCDALAVPPGDACRG